MLVLNQEKSVKKIEGLFGKSSEGNLFQKEKVMLVHNPKKDVKESVYLFNTPGDTLNSKKKKETIFCTLSYPCKRMTCSSCVSIRRNYFIKHSFQFSKDNDLNCHLVVNWSCKDTDDVWQVVLKDIPIFTKLLSGRIGPYIRTLGLGESHNPHIHFLLRREKVSLIRRIAKIFYKKYPNKKFTVEEVTNDKFSIKEDRCRAITVVEKNAPGPHELLGYFFDQNFLPLFNHLARPKGLRIISGSRGVSYGFPKRKRIIRHEQLGFDIHDDGMCDEKNVSQEPERKNIDQVLVCDNSNLTN